MINPKVNALAIGAASFASTSKDTADSAAHRETPNTFRVDEAMCGYADIPENRIALKELFDEARPILKQPLHANFDYGTPGL